jgi:osmotically-inducible protein OsmY
MTGIDSSEPAEYVAERLREAIATEPDVYQLGITVNVVGDQVHLSGPASTAAQRQAIVALVERLAPELHVVDDLEVPSLSQPSDVEELS